MRAPLWLPAGLLAAQLLDERFDLPAREAHPLGREIDFGAPFAQGAAHLFILAQNAHPRENLEHAFGKWLDLLASEQAQLEHWLLLFRHAALPQFHACGPHPASPRSMTCGMMVACTDVPTDWVGRHRWGG